MARLMLLRHAKAEWAEPGQRDYDRVLSEEGQRECASVAQQMVDKAIMPDAIICSEAVRARETVDHMHPVIHFTSRMLFEKDLYATDAPGYLEIAAASGATGDIMLVGHNPMMEDLAYGLAENGDETAVSGLNMGFRTCGLAILRFDNDIASIGSQKGFLEAYIVPA